jgi:glycosyltransferase involved in cell wall biosynthesis
MTHVVMTLLGDIRYDGRVRKEIQTLTKAGHEVELVVADFTKTRFGGEDLGIRIHYIPMRLWSSPMLNFVSQLRFNKAAAAIIRGLKPSYIHCHDLNTLLAGVWAKKKTGAKLIFDAHELMPESMGGIREAIWGRIEKICVKSCDGLLMPEKHRIDYFKQKYPDIAEISLLENFPRRTDIPAQAFDLFRPLYSIGKDQKIVLHTGLIAAKRNVEELIDSMALCSEEFVLIVLGRTFKGYGERLRARIRKSGLERRVFLHDAVPHARILEYMASCDIGTAFYSNININNYYCASNKLFEYIAIGKPVLTNNYPGLVERVESFAQGVCLEEITPATLAEAYARASDTHVMKPGAQKFFWETQSERLDCIYQTATDQDTLYNSAGDQLPEPRLAP